MRSKEIVDGGRENQRMNERWEKWQFTEITYRYVLKSHDDIQEISFPLRMPPELSLWIYILLYTPCGMLITCCFCFPFNHVRWMRLGFYHCYFGLRNTGCERCLSANKFDLLWKDIKENLVTLIGQIYSS